MATASAAYPLKRKREDPDFATQSHQDQMDALVSAMRGGAGRGRNPGEQVEAIALDTTGSSVIPVDAGLQPLDDYYLWCDHRAKGEAQEITETRPRSSIWKRSNGAAASTPTSGDSPSCCTGCATIPEKRGQLASAFEHCDMVAATLCGITDPKRVKRSICAMGHKWMWNPEVGRVAAAGLPLQRRPAVGRHPRKTRGRVSHLRRIWRAISRPHGRRRLGLRAGIPIPVGAFDAHWDAIGAGCSEGDVVNVVGTSTCIIAMQRKTTLIPGVCGVVPGSVHPGYTGIEAGLSATGDIFEAIARRANVKVAELSRGLESYRPGQTGLLRLSWDNGDRTVLVNPELGGITLGWNLVHTAQDELFAAIEGTAFHTRIILERMAEYGVPVDRVINGGGVPQNNPVLNQVYANVLGKPVLVPDGIPTSLGSGIFALLGGRRLLVRGRGAGEDVPSIQDLSAGGQGGARV